MILSRREAIKVLAGTAAAAAGVTLAAQPAASATDLPRWGMVVDLRKCIGCQACTVACNVENQVPLGYFRTISSIYEVETAGQIRRVQMPRTCNQCGDPPCVRVCPTQATYQREDGIVVVDNTVCIGCGYCVQTCPYSARFINPETHTADKCTFCLHRVQAGLLPACVETCVGGARIFGDLNDPASRVSQLLAQFDTRVLKPYENTEPNVFYIGLDEALQGKVQGQPLYRFQSLFEEVQSG
ncbi:MAG: 4Fe-4S dicluster domain-containing protein [Anaerolineales bacterium]|jgi:tetrathionate reductase subunit B